MYDFHVASYQLIQVLTHLRLFAIPLTVQFYHTECIFLCLSKCRHDTFPCVYLGAHSELFMPILEHRIHFLVLMSLNIWFILENTKSKSSCTQYIYNGYLFVLNGEHSRFPLPIFMLGHAGYCYVSFCSLSQ